MKHKWFLLLLVSGSFTTSAQVRPIGSLDSAAIKTLFFAGLRDKLSENYSKASESFTQILSIDPDNAAVHYELAVLNFRQNKLQEAEVNIKKATALDPNNEWYWKMLAELHKRSGNMDALIKVFNEMIRLSPDNEAYYFDRSNAWLLAGQQTLAAKGYDELEQRFGPSEALTDARERMAGDKKKATDVDPNSPIAMLKYAESLYKKGDLNAALEQYKKILESTDDLYSVWEQTLSIQKTLGLYKDLIETANDALAIYPNQGILYYYLAQALINGREYQEALVNIKFALQLDIENAVYMECYGDVLSLSGDTNAAIAEWKKAKAGGANSEKLKRKINEKKYIP